MKLFGGVIPVTGTTFLMFCLFAVLFVGYAVGRIKVKGISLGDAAVFVIALVFGALLFEPLSAQLVLKGEAEAVDFTEKALDIIEKVGLIFFVTSVGFIAGPKFFGNFKRNFKSYVLLGLIIIIAGGLAAVGCIYMGSFVGYGPAKTPEGFTAMIVGLLSGSLTSTPAFSAAKATVTSEAAALGVDYTNLVSVGHGIAYIFGVIGVVLFVQLVPKFVKANMEEERAKLSGSDGNAEDPVDTKCEKKLINIDSFGIAPFAIAAVIGLLVGSIKIGSFSLTTTGGYLLVSLVFGHFAKIGKINLMPPAATLKVFREFGLMLFLIGAGIAGGAKFVECFQPIYFLYGALMTIIPMIIGFFFAKFVLKLSLLNNLGSITGGMTSTPALGTLISVAGTEDVATAYAATYPIALISVVLASQFLIMIF